MLALLLAAVLIGDPLPALSLRSVPGGESVELPVHGRITVIDLFATWCGPCRESLPVLERLRNRYGDRVEFVSIAEDRDVAKVERFVHGLHVGGRVLLDPARRAYRALGAHELPTTYLVDSEGVVRKINHGYGHGYEARVAGWIEQLLGSKPKR
ncbi:MAG TPA: TlpA disulfide reductase family protein [Polyangiales bacterium]